MKNLYIFILFYGMASLGVFLLAEETAPSWAVMLSCFCVAFGGTGLAYRKWIK